MRQLDLNLLLVLHALFEERSVTAVARRLQVSQPTVSLSLSKLRDFFHDELFVRHGGKMQPTPFVEMIYESVRTIIETINKEVLREHDFDPLVTDRTFSLSTSDLGELVFLPKILEALRVAAPRACVRCLAMPPVELQAAMANGAVDLALGYFPDLIGAGFYQQKLFEHSFTCLVRRDHPTIDHDMTLDQFLAADHAVVAPEGRSQEIFERRMSELNLERRIALRSPHITTVPLLVATSDLITVVPRAVGDLYARFACLKLVDPPISIPPIEIKQFWHRRVHNDPGVVWVRKLVAQLFLHQDSSADPNSPIFALEAGNGRNPFRLCEADGEAFRRQSSVDTDK
jgi:DNA-binding transcriptional LysR family regulator